MALHSTDKALHQTLQGRRLLPALTRGPRAARTTLQRLQQAQEGGRRHQGGGGGSRSLLLLLQRCAGRGGSGSGSRGKVTVHMQAQRL